MEGRSARTTGWNLASQPNVYTTENLHDAEYRRERRGDKIIKNEILVKRVIYRK
jgi:hypothetical protein